MGLDMVRHLCLKGYFLNKQEIIEVYDAKTGRVERLQHVYVQVEIKKSKEFVHDEKRSASRDRAEQGCK